MSGYGNTSQDTRYANPNYKDRVRVHVSRALEHFLYVMKPARS